MKLKVVMVMAVLCVVTATHQPDQQPEEDEEAAVLEDFHNNDRDTSDFSLTERSLDSAREAEKRSSRASRGYFDYPRKRKGASRGYFDYPRKRKGKHMSQVSASPSVEDKTRVFVEQLIAALTAWKHAWENMVSDKRGNPGYFRYHTKSPRELKGYFDYPKRKSGHGKNLGDEMPAMIGEMIAALESLKQTWANMWTEKRTKRCGYFRYCGKNKRKGKGKKGKRDDLGGDEAEKVDPERKGLYGKYRRFRPRHCGYLGYCGMYMNRGMSNKGKRDDLGGDEAEKVDPEQNTATPYKVPETKEGTEAGAGENGTNAAHYLDSACGRYLLFFASKQRLVPAQLIRHMGENQNVIKDRLLLSKYTKDGNILQLCLDRFK